MTGFGRGQAALSSGKVIVELKTLNHKYQDVRLHLAPELVVVDEEVDRRLREQLTRGRIELTAKLQGRAPVAVRLDKALARSCLEELEELREQMGLSQPVSMDVLAAIPQVFLQETSFSPEEVRDAVFEALDQAIAANKAMRVREAEALSRDLDSRLDHVKELVAEIDETSKEVAPRVLERLRQRIARLITDGQLDESRLAQESALIADRCDVAEELTRLDSHVDQFRRIGAESGPVGRRLDFLLQEMAREASIIGAKAQDAEVQHLIVELRGEITRIREQIQNIE